MKAIAILVAVFIILSPSITFEKEVGNVLYVGGSGAGNYTSIQDAINDAGNGYTIYVYPKQYNESVVINKSISLIGIVENGEKPIIHGIGNKTTVLIKGERVIVKNFEIRNGGIGIEINSSFAKIENNTVEYAGIGIVAHSSSNLIKRNTVIKSEGIGIWIDKTSTHNILIFNSILYNGWSGIWIDGNNNAILYNNVTRNGGGIDLSVADNCTVSFNHAYRNGEDGINVDMCNNITMKNNILHDNAIAGIQMMDCYHCIVEGNEMYRNQGGIMVQSADSSHEKQYNIIRRNNITYNKDVGIYVEFSIMNTFEENNLIHNKVDAWFWYMYLFDTDHWRDFLFRPCHNTWRANYWSDWKFPVPKPITGIVDIFIFLFDRWFYYTTLPCYNFDFHPAMEPYEK